jgi:hypothetical protein
MLQYNFNAYFIIELSDQHCTVNYLHASNAVKELRALGILIADISAGNAGTIHTLLIRLQHNRIDKME